MRAVHAERPVHEEHDRDEQRGQEERLKRRDQGVQVEHLRWAWTGSLSVGLDAGWRGAERMLRRGHMGHPDHDVETIGWIAGDQ